MCACVRVWILVYFALAEFHAVVRFVFVPV